MKKGKGTIMVEIESPERKPLLETVVPRWEISRSTHLLTPSFGGEVRIGFARADESEHLIDRNPWAA